MQTISEQIKSHRLSEFSVGGWPELNLRRDVRAYSEPILDVVKVVTHDFDKP